MKSRHVIQVSSFYPPHLGGQEHAVRDLSRQLVQAGHRVDVLTSAVGASTRGSSVEDGVRVQRLAALELAHTPVMPGLARSLDRLITPQSLIHVHIGQAFTPEIAWRLAHRRQVPFVAQLHIDFKPSGPAGFLLPLYKRLLLGPVLRAASAVIVLNQPTLRLAAEQYGVKAQLMPNGINEVYFSIQRKALASQPPDLVRLIYVGRLSKQKNILTLLQALAHLRQSVHLDIIGDGEEQRQVHDMVHELKLAKNVTLHGRLSRQEVRTFYESSDALILPSLYEAQPLVLLEAMAARLPIIGTDVIGVGEHIKSIGIVTPPTVSGLRRGIEAYFNQHHELPAMVERGFQKALHLRWPHLLAQYEALYDTAASR